MTYFRDKLEKCDEKSNRRKKSDWCKFLHFFVVIIFFALSLPFPESVEHDTNQRRMKKLRKKIISNGIMDRVPNYTTIMWD